MYRVIVLMLYHARDNMSLRIRLAQPSDAGALWAIMEPIIRAGDTYALPPAMQREEALAYWLAPDHTTFVAIVDGEIQGTYFMRQNQQGGGAHVANCGYMTASSAFGRGVASAMCAHSLQEAKARAFRAMQFNFVISTNERAVRLWQRFGFAIVGRLPEAFKHPSLGFVEVFVMYRLL